MQVWTGPSFSGLSPHWAERLPSPPLPAQSPEAHPEGAVSSLGSPPWVPLWPGTCEQAQTVWGAFLPLARPSLQGWVWAVPQGLARPRRPPPGSLRSAGALAGSQLRWRRWSRPPRSHPLPSSICSGPGHGQARRASSPTSASITPSAASPVPPRSWALAAPAQVHCGEGPPRLLASPGAPGTPLLRPGPAVPPVPLSPLLPMCPLPLPGEHLLSSRALLRATYSGGRHPAPPPSG